MQFSPVAIVLTLVGILAVLVGIKGSGPAVFKTLTGHTTGSGTSSSGGGIVMAPGSITTGPSSMNNGPMITGPANLFPLPKTALVG